MARSGTRNSGFSGSESISVAVNCPRPATTNPMATGERRERSSQNDLGKREDPAARHPDLPLAHCPFEFVARFLDLRDGGRDRLVAGEPASAGFLQAGVEFVSRIPVVGLCCNDVDDLLEEFQLGTRAVLGEKQFPPRFPNCSVPP